MSPIHRKLARVRTLPPPSPGQFGADHTAIEVIRPQEWNEADPFILLMDDRVDGLLRAGPHPHAGFETVTFVVEGKLASEHQGGGALSVGDVEWTTAGSGIVHGPDAPVEGKIRVLQLWLNLPKAQRWTEPDHQVVRRGDALVRREAGATAHLYSGSTGALRSPTRNRVPTTLIDLCLEPGSVFTQELPETWNGFLYGIEGEVRVGEEADSLALGQIGWLDRSEAEGETHVQVANTGDSPARVLLYAGQRQNTELAWYGPFIGDTREDIVRSFERYQAGTFRRV